MNVFLNRLLNGQSVEWKTLGEVCELSNIGVDKKINENEQKVRLLNFVDVFKNQYLSNATPTMIVSASDKKIVDCDIKEGDVFITPSSEIIDEIGQSAMALEDINNAVYSYHIMRLRIFDRNVINPKFLNFLFQSNDVKRQMRLNAQGITRFGLTQPKWKSLILPIPPLPVQQKIVQILDTLTALTAELTAEYTLRLKQYQYYRDKLLSENELNKVGFEYQTLDKISENLNYMRKPVKSGLRESGAIPYYGASGIVDYVDDYIFDDDLLLISEDGANLLARNTPIAFSVTGKCWVNNHAHVLKFDTYAQRKYVEYYFNHLDLTPYITGSAQPKLNKQNLNSINIPIPPLSEQIRIVNILDKFETLTQSMTEGLPKEIELRQKQYEYYREVLLDFDKSC